MDPKKFFAELTAPMFTRSQKAGFLWGNAGIAQLVQSG
jgi:hypothetical protein